MNNKGFTLVEVLVSLALVSVIAIFLFQIIFIVRDIYAEKNIKSEIYIESANISNVINKDIFEKDKDGIYIKNINKVSNDELYITYSDGIKSNIIINRENNTITYGNYTVSILDVADIGNIELYYNYDTSTIDKNGICYIKIPITHEDYKNDFGVVITYRYDSSKTKINGEVSIRPGRPDNECSIALGTVWNFDYTGNVQEFSVPCEGTYKIETWGAQGGTNIGTNNKAVGGYGGYSTGNVTLLQNDTMYIVVGQKGNSSENYIPYNGGGRSTSMGGGGATHIAINTNRGELKQYENNVSEIMIVSGGGGGSDAPTGWQDATSTNPIVAGSGGGYIGNASTFRPGYGGTQIEGGTGYLSGSFGQGGNSVTTGDSGGAGGGGYYGGGSGSNYTWSDGGGGSGYIGNTSLTAKKMVCYNCQTSDAVDTKTETTTCTNANPTSDCAKQGNGYARITLLSY